MEEFLKRNDLTGGTAVLSRVNKPLVALAFRLIRQRIPCRVEGRDIASRIVKLIQRWKVKSLDGLEKKLDTYLEKETVKLLAKKQEAKLAEVEDAVETVRVVIDQCRLEKKTQVQDAVDYVNGLFADNVKDMLVLSSIHKSKGREWQRVFWLDRHGTCPSKWARQAWQQEQERNLMYVAATRAQELLVDLEPAPKEAA
jgi:superfamily I DNA/RNA helicase